MDTAPAQDVQDAPPLRLLKWTPAQFRRWADAPRRSRTPVAGTRFLALKVPLGEVYDADLEEGDGFTPTMYVQRMLATSPAPTIVAAAFDGCFSAARATYHHAGDWDDWDCRLFVLDAERGVREPGAADAAQQRALADARDLVDSGAFPDTDASDVAHLKPPSDAAVDAFVRAAQRALVKRPDGHFAVFSRYGFNAAGYLIVSYMCSVLRTPLRAALAAFAAARPPGIYSPACLAALGRRWDDAASSDAASSDAAPGASGAASGGMPAAPPPPAWESPQAKTLIASQAAAEAELARTRAAWRTRLMEGDAAPLAKGRVVASGSAEEKALLLLASRMLGRPRDDVRYPGLAVPSGGEESAAAAASPPPPPWGRGTESGVVAARCRPVAAADLADGAVAGGPGGRWVSWLPTGRRMCLLAPGDADRQRHAVLVSPSYAVLRRPSGGMQFVGLRLRFFGRPRRQETRDRSGSSAADDAAQIPTFATSPFGGALVDGCLVADRQPGGRPAQARYLIEDLLSRPAAEEHAGPGPDLPKRLKRIQNDLIAPRKAPANAKRLAALASGEREEFRVRMRDCFPATSKRVKWLVRELLPQLTHDCAGLLFLASVPRRAASDGEALLWDPAKSAVGKDALLGAMAEAERGGGTDFTRA
jgi:hypothetical protein